MELHRADLLSANTEADENFEELLAYLQTESQRVRKQTKAIKYGVGVVGGLATISILTAGLLKGNWDFTTLICMSGLLGGVAMASTDQMKSAARKLSRYNDVRAVGVLVEALEWTDSKDVVKLAEGKLLELLPQMQASDASLLHTEQRAILNCKLLTADNDFVKVILKAYEQIGDSAAMPFVEKLARGEGKSGSITEVVTAAKECLPFLVQRAKQQEQAQTLLRAASENTTAPETLLRPANATLETQPETLLRPTQQ